LFGIFPSKGVWRRPGLRPVDLLVFAALLALLFGLLRLAPALNAPFLPKTAPSTVSTDPANLPYYAVRSLFRMFIALTLSVLFTFVYATAAARLPRAEKVLVPVLDILQSVPVLGFLAVTVTAFIDLFPGSEPGASAIPSDLREAMRLMGVRGRVRWTKFILPAIFPAYVTGGITAAGGAWNAAIVAEVITYGHHHLTATGLGAYIAQATRTGDFPEVLIGVVVMSVYVVGLNRLVWRRLYRLAETRYSL
jgi:NitT/TauT family transport system permease protein